MSKSPVYFRQMSQIIGSLLKQFPMISITGPRQSGKTTLSHLACNGYMYINLEIDEYREFAERDPGGFLEKFKGKIILDEVQNVPKLFPYLQHLTDQRKKKGEYVLSGSKNFLLMEKISESLAGRIAILNLLPLSTSEIWPYLKPKHRGIHHLIQRGFYPRLVQDYKMSSRIFYSSYIKTYIEKDLRSLLKVHNLRAFQQFIKLCAARVGAIFNANDIGRQLGVDNKTVQHWISVMEASYIVYLLPSYYNNYDKRILKKPKLYFYDTGLLCYLLGIHTPVEMSTHRMYGHIFENYILLEYLKQNFNKGIHPEIYYWQDNNGREVDLILEQDGVTLFSEIKSAHNVYSEDFANLNLIKKLANEKKQNSKTRLIYGGPDTYLREGHEVYSWLNFSY